MLKDSQSSQNPARWKARVVRAYTGLALLGGGMFFCATAADGQDATWLLSPGSSDWDTATNWTPATVPTGTATFGASNTTTITFSSTTGVGEIQLNAGAPAYTFDISSSVLEINGTGIVNNSSNPPTLNNIGPSGTFFLGTSTAGNAIIINQAQSGGFTEFANSSTAGNATITATGSGTGATFFVDTSTAGNATVIATSGAFTEFAGSSAAGSATVITDSGGFSVLLDTASGGQAQSITNAGGVFDISLLSSAGTTVGSIAGAGNYNLGSKTLIVGSNNLSTDVSGIIADGGFGGGTGGSLVKVGAGTLTLSGDNTYTGGTTISAGTLQLGAGGATGSIVGNVTDNATLAFDRSDSATFSGVISGAGVVDQIGGGTRILTGANTYSGGTTISAGVLQLGAGGTTGSIVGNVTDNATLAFDRSDSVTFSGVISGAGVVDQIGVGTTILTGTNTYSRGTTISAGVLQVSNDSSVGTGGIALDGGAFRSGATGLSFANPFAIDTTGGTIDTQASALTLSGPITNGNGPTGALTKIGAGVLTLSGVSSYTGPTNVNAGTLQAGAANALAPSSAFTVASGATLDLAGFDEVIGSLAGAGVVSNSGASGAILTAGGDNASTVFSGVIEDDGPTGLTKAGSGTLVLSGTNTYTGPTSVQSGVLDVTGSIALSSLTTVSGGAILTGAGAVGATRINSGGVLAPGSGAPGSSMSVYGPLTFSAGATYRVEVSPTAASLAKATGPASLSGIVLADFASGRYLSRQYTILTAGGGVGGTTFAGLSTIDAPAGFAESLAYDADDVYLNLFANLALVGGLNVNQRNVADALDGAFNGGASLPPSFVSLFGFTDDALAGALTELSGEAATGARQSEFLFNDMFLSLLLDPHVENRGGGIGQAGSFGAGPGCPTEDKAQSSAAALPTRKPSTAEPALPCAPHWTVWGAGFGGGEQVSGSAVIGSHDTSMSAGGFAVGADDHVSRDAMLGFAVAGGGMSWSLSGGLGGGNSPVFEAGLYGVEAFGSAYVAGALSFGEYWLATNRTVGLTGGGAYSANFDAQGIGGRIETGYHVSLASLTLTPYAAAQAQAFEAPSYAESALSGWPGFALNYASQSATDTRFELGAWADKTFVAPDGNALKLFGRLAWAHDWQSTPELTATFQSLPAASFAVNGAKPAADQALITAGAEWRFARNWTLMAKFEGEFGVGAQAYSGTARVSYAW